MKMSQLEKNDAVRKIAEDMAYKIIADQRLPYKGLDPVILGYNIVKAIERCARPGNADTREPEKPETKVININIESLVKSMTVGTSVDTATAEQVRKEMTRILLAVVDDTKFSRPGNGPVTRPDHHPSCWPNDAGRQRREELTRTSPVPVSNGFADHQVFISEIGKIVYQVISSQLSDLKRDLKSKVDLGKAEQ